MASIKIRFRPSTIQGHPGSIYYQIIHQRKIRQIPTRYKIFPAEWDRVRSTVITTRISPRKNLIISIAEEIRRDMERIKTIVARFEQSPFPFSADDIVGEFRRYAAQASTFNFMETIILSLKQSDRIRTSETYRTALNAFRKFTQGRDLRLEAITPGLMENYEAWLKKRGLAPNTISFYTRIMRAVYNRAVEAGLTENLQPFRRVYTGIDKTVKRALPLASIKRIKNLDLSARPMLDFARDIFMMSFYLRGMSFIDMAFLRKSDLRQGCISYRRRKTGQLLLIEWTPEMQTLLEKYPANESEYLLPLIRRKGINEWAAYRNAAYRINRHLKQVAAMAAIPIPLTLYVARHSWASAAKSKGIPISVISEGMGHDSETTTRIYLASLETSEVDKANALIISSL